MEHGLDKGPSGHSFSSSINLLLLVAIPEKTGEIIGRSPIIRRTRGAASSP